MEDYLGAPDIVNLQKCSPYLQEIGGIDSLWKLKFAQVFELGRASLEFCGNWQMSTLKYLGLPAFQPQFQEIPVYSDFLHRNFCSDANVLPLLKTPSPRIIHPPGTDLEKLERIGEPFVLEVPQKTRIDGETLKNWCPPECLLDLGDIQASMSAYLEYAQCPQREPLLLFHPVSGDFRAKLDEHVQYPPYFDDDHFNLLAEDRPLNFWILVGNKNSGSKWHKDPNATNAWNLVLKGRKLWLFYPPHTPPPGVQPSQDGGEVCQPEFLYDWFQAFYHLLDPDLLIEFVCEANQLVFVPSGWWHAVINLDDETIAVTKNYVSHQNLPKVLNFLKDKKDQISGTCDSELYEKFHQVLQKNGVEFPNESNPSRGFWNRKMLKRKHDQL